MSLKPISSSRPAGRIGVLPPSTMLAICGTGTRGGMAASSSTESGASTKGPAPPRLGVGDRPADRLFQSVPLAGIRPRQNHGIRIAARLDGSGNLGLHLLHPDDLLPLEVPAALGEDLVLEHDRRGPGALQLTDGSPDVERVAIARIGVYQDRNLDRLDH